MDGANEVVDALYIAADGSDSEDVRHRILTFVRELPEEMTVQEIVASLRVGGEDDEEG